MLMFFSSYYGGKITMAIGLRYLFRMFFVITYTSFGLVDNFYVQIFNALSYFIIQTLYVNHNIIITALPYLKKTKNFYAYLAWSWL